MLKVDSARGRDERKCREIIQVAVTTRVQFHLLCTPLRLTTQAYQLASFRWPTNNGGHLLLDAARKDEDEKMSNTLHKAAGKAKQIRSGSLDRIKRTEPCN